MLLCKKLKPGQPGTRQLLAQYGQRLFCVRYRYDTQTGKRLKTVELVVEESPWPAPARSSAEEIVGVRVSLPEVDLQRRLKQAGGRWNPSRKLWEVSYQAAVALKLTNRLERLRDPKNVSDNGKANVSGNRK